MSKMNQIRKETTKRTGKNSLRFWENLKPLMERIINETGHFPRLQEMRDFPEIGPAALTAATKYHGGIDSIRMKMGYPEPPPYEKPKKKKENGVLPLTAFKNHFLNIWNKTVLFPTAKDIEGESEKFLKTIVFYGGIEGVRKDIFNFEQEPVPESEDFSKWKSLKAKLVSITDFLCHFPSFSELIEMRYWNLIPFVKDQENLDFMKFRIEREDSVSFRKRHNGRKPVIGRAESEKCGKIKQNWKKGLLSEVSGSRRLLIENELEKNPDGTYSLWLSKMFGIKVDGIYILPDNRCTVLFPSSEARIIPLYLDLYYGDITDKSEVVEYLFRKSKELRSVGPDTLIEHYLPVVKMMWLLREYFVSTSFHPRYIMNEKEAEFAKRINRVFYGKANQPAFLEDFYYKTLPWVFKQIDANPLGISEEDLYPYIDNLVLITGE
ncbi:hypothetical protein JXB01_00590 [Candidatus Micrarchaeota archaeon]|nr:hypothetical protein [Candidatus Micrarchaeota archaeon]